MKTEDSLTIIRGPISSVTSEIKEDNFINKDGLTYVFFLNCFFMCQKFNLSKKIQKIAYILLLNCTFSNKKFNFGINTHYFVNFVEKFDY